MPGWLLNLCYWCFLLLVSPVLLWKMIGEGKYRTGWSEKFFGRVPILPAAECSRIWLHAVSVGEVLQLRQVVKEILSRDANFEIVISTTTDTGFSVAQEQFPDHEVIRYPLDFTWAVKNALRRIQPDLVVLVELELWPNFIHTAHRLQVPVVVINGRLSERSFRGYRRIRSIVSRLLQDVRLIAAQNHEYAQRFLDLGCRTDQVIVTGSIKFDGVRTERETPKAIELRNWLQLADDQQLLIAGSTQDPEEEIVLDVFQKLMRGFPNLRLLIVPRHPNRGGEIMQSIQRRRWNVLQRSAEVTPVEVTTKTVGLLDTVGELSDAWGLADVAFVGGSFGDRGGQNMLEPAALGVPVCFGPNTVNFKQIAEQLLGAGGAQRVHSFEELESFISSMLQNSERAHDMGQAASTYVLQQQGATARTVDLIQRCLS